MIARRDIATLADLAASGWRPGCADSGTDVTAGLILDLAQVQPAERRALGAGRRRWRRCWPARSTPCSTWSARRRTASPGRIDPAAFHLLPLTDAGADRGLRAGRDPRRRPIPSSPSRCRWSRSRPSWSPSTSTRGENSYQAASCRLVADLGHLVLTRLDELRADGHPKWAAVRPDGHSAGLAGLGLRPRRPRSGLRLHLPQAGRDGGAGGAGGVAESEANRLYLQRVCARMGC